MSETDIRGGAARGVRLCRRAGRRVRLPDIAPPQATSFVGSTMNAFGNAAGIVAPIVIGYAVQATGSFTVALRFVAAQALPALVGLAVTGTVRRIAFDRP